VTSGAVLVLAPAGIHDPTRPSGGNTYDRLLCRELECSGWSVRLAEVEGFALGGGFELALMADITVVGANTEVGMPGTRLLGPALGSLHMFFHRLGPVQARRLLLTEGGNYAYDDSEMRRYVLSTRAHNTLRVDNQDQNRRLRFDRLNVNLNVLADAGWPSTPDYDLAEAPY